VVDVLNNHAASIFSEEILYSENGGVEKVTLTPTLVRTSTSYKEFK